MRVGGQLHAPAALPRERDAVPILEEAGWAPGPVDTKLNKFTTSEYLQILTSDRVQTEVVYILTSCSFVVSMKQAVFFRVQFLDPNVPCHFRFRFKLGQNL
jgi:hypothetical protein